MCLGEAGAPIAWVRCGPLVVIKVFFLLIMQQCAFSIQRDDGEPNKRFLPKIQEQYFVWQPAVWLKLSVERPRTKNTVITQTGQVYVCRDPAGRRLLPAK